MANASLLLRPEESVALATLGVADGHEGRGFSFKYISDQGLALALEKLRVVGECPTDRLELELCESTSLFALRLMAGVSRLARSDMGTLQFILLIQG